LTTNFGAGTGGALGDPLIVGLPILTPGFAPATENVPEPASLGILLLGLVFRRQGSRSTYAGSAENN
jgi:hypothetical protein